MEVRLLGPLEVMAEGVPLEIAAPKERAVLAVLGLRGDEVVPAELLVDALWGQDPPPSAVKSLHSHLSRLRRALPDGAIVTAGPGYRLVIDRDDVDALRLGGLVDAGRQAVDAGDPGRALALLDEALGLWRGVPLADLADGEFRRGNTAHLHELRAGAEELRIEALLALGHHEQVVGELEVLVADEPLRERRWAQLLVALYRSNRRADALAAYQRLRRLLGEELGLEPSEELRDLEARILRDDPTLEVTPAPVARNLPQPLTSFVGRERLVREVRKLLHTNRLVSLVGPGGVGKSRLALEVAGQELRSWADGVWWLDLARVDEATGLMPHLARTLGVAVPPGSTSAEALRWALGPQQLLLVLDNAEAVAGAMGPQLADVLEAGPGLAALITSRVPSSVPGQREVLVPPLELPDADTHDVVAVESVRLLLDRLQDHDTTVPDAADLDAVADLCRLVDGFPLGIELIAAGVGHRAPAEVLQEMEDRSVLLAEPAPGHDLRHASLRAVLDSSLDLLGPDARRCLGLLAAIPGDIETAIARSIVGPALARALDRLVAGGLVTRADGVAGDTRVGLLDTVRAFARSACDPADRAEGARRHAELFRDLAREAGDHMEGTDEALWLERLRREDDNLRAALAWFEAHDPPGALAFANALGRAWYAWGDLDGVITLLERLLDVAAGHAVEPADVGWLHLRLAWPRFFRGDPSGARTAMEEAAARFEHLGMAQGVAVTRAAQAHLALLSTGDADAALAGYRTALDASRRAGLDAGTAWILVQAAQALLMADRADEAVDEMLAEAEAIFGEADNHLGLAHVELDRMFAAYARDRLDEADLAALAGIEHSRAADNPGYAHILVVARAAIRVHRGELDAAATMVRRALAWARRHHQLFVIGLALHCAAVLAAQAGDPVRAATLWGAAANWAPLWPLFARRYGALVQPAHDALGEDFEVAAATGRTLSLPGVLDLAGSALDLPA